MKKINFSEKIKNIKFSVMKKNNKSPKLDASKLNPTPDELNISSKVYKYHPDIEAYEEVVKNGTGNVLNKLKEKFSP